MPPIKSILLFLLIFSITKLFAQKTVIQNNSEHLKYKVHYGIINAGEILIEVDSSYYIIDSIVCTKVAVNGKTTGLTSAFAKINDVFISYIDTITQLPHKFQRVVNENSYQKWETYTFDRENNQAIVSTKNGDQAYVMENYNINSKTHDLVSAYMNLRTINFDTLKTGSIFKIDVFLENKLINMNFRFVGRKKTRTSIGRFKSIVVSPIMPENSIFDGENAIEALISDDENKIPLKIKAKLLVGAVEVDIIDYKKKSNQKTKHK